MSQEMAPVGFTIKSRIRCNVDRAWKAVVDPDELSRYFVKSASWCLTEPGKFVDWSWGGGEEATLLVEDVVPKSRVQIRWPNCNRASQESTRVSIEFKASGDNESEIQIAEHGWSSDREDLQAAFGNCEGWQHMLCCMKAWIEHGIDLRR